tara:strand:- start:155 stop:298 length:144 start_codon:yes stop_codon:yes gene_type:complete
MTTLILTLLFACGDKEEETDSAVKEAAEEVAEESTEEAEDTAASEEE